MLFLEPSDPVARVELSLTEAALWIEDEVTITANLFSSTGAPLTGRTVTWTSDAEPVATVDAQGRVVARGVGAARITAASEGQSAHATVEVATYDLVYESGPVHAPELFRITLDGEAAPQRVLPAGTFGADPAPSPDGQAIAFVGNTGTYNRDIYVVDLDGGAISRLTTDALDDDMPAWGSSDRIVFRSQRVSADDLFIMDRSGEPAVNLTPDPGNAAFIDRSPAWSPDGMHIAFNSNRNGPTNVWVMDADGGNKQALTNASSQSEPAWSPDGERIAFRGSVDGGLDIVIFDVSDGSSVSIDLPGEQWTPAWSPDGRWITFAQRMNQGSPFEIYRMRVDGSDVTLVTRDLAWGGGRNPAFIIRRS
jgi:Tol biopolymer transport system component